MIEEWDKFRGDPDKYKGTITSWNLEVFFVYEYLKGYAGEKVMFSKGKGIRVYGPAKNRAEALLSYNELVLLGRAPKISANDWITVTGKFEGISNDGEVILRAIQIKNEGYKR